MRRQRPTWLAPALALALILAPAELRADIVSDTYAQFGAGGAPDHLATTQGTAPTVTGGGGSGAAVTAGSTDTAGSVNTGSSASTSTTITFNRLYGVIPWCVGNPANAVAAAAALYTVPTSQTLIFTYTSATAAIFSYHCIGQKGG